MNRYTVILELDPVGAEHRRLEVVIGIGIPRNCASGPSTPQEAALRG